MERARKRPQAAARAVGSGVRCRSDLGSDCTRSRRLLGGVERLRQQPTGGRVRAGRGRRGSVGGRLSGGRRRFRWRLRRLDPDRVDRARRTSSRRCEGAGRSLSDRSGFLTPLACVRGRSARTLQRPGPEVSPLRRSKDFDASGLSTEAVRVKCLSATTTAAKRAQSVHPGRCRAASATSVAEEASPSSTTDSVRRVRRHVARPVALNWFRCVPVSAGSRSRAGGAGEARKWCASRWFRTWSSAPPEPRLNESPRARAPRSPGVADGRCRGSSTDESRSSPLVELEIRSDDTTGPPANFFHLTRQPLDYARFGG